MDILKVCINFLEVAIEINLGETTLLIEFLFE